MDDLHVVVRDGLKHIVVETDPHPRLLLVVCPAGLGLKKIMSMKFDGGADLVIAERIKASGLLGLGDKGYVGLSEAVLCPFKGRGKPQWQKDVNSDHAKLRSPGERAIAQLKSWDVRPRLRCCPHRAGEITRAVLVLQLREAG